jgi:hypothetical protein
VSASVTTREVEVGGVRVTAAVFPASWLAVAVGRTSARDILARDPAFAAALDGPMFDDRGRPQYLAMGPGAQAPSQFPTRGATLAVDRNGRAQVVDGGVAPADSVVAVQGYPALVRRGVNVASREIDTSRRSRAAFGVLADGTVFFAASRAAGMHAFAEALVQLGAVDAAYTDGGSSTALLLGVGGVGGVGGAGGVGTSPRVLVGDAADNGAHATDAKRLPSWLLARNPTVTTGTTGTAVTVVPSATNPVVRPSASAGPLAAVAVLLAASGVTAWWLLRSRKVPRSNPRSRQRHRPHAAVHRRNTAAPPPLPRHAHYAQR